MSTIIYKPRTHLFGNDTAKLIGEELERIRLKYNRVNANKEIVLNKDDVLLEAKDIKNPLYPFIEWDNKKASDNYRLTQISNIINSIEVVYIKDNTPKEKQIIVPMYVKSSSYNIETNKTNKNTGEYVSFITVKNKVKFKKNQTIEFAEKVKQLCKRYSYLSCLEEDLKKLNSIADNIIAKKLT
jgi:hypothetical protein